MEEKNDKNGDKLKESASLEIFLEIFEQKLGTRLYNQICFIIEGTRDLRKKLAQLETDADLFAALGMTIAHLLRGLDKDSQILILETVRKDLVPESGEKE